jgi:hypothetical protein
LCSSFLFYTSPKPFYFFYFSLHYYFRLISLIRRHKIRLISPNFNLLHLDVFFCSLFNDAFSISASVV